MTHVVTFEVTEMAAIGRLWRAVAAVVVLDALRSHVLGNDEPARTGLLQVVHDLGPPVSSR